MSHKTLTGYLCLLSVLAPALDADTGADPLSKLTVHGYLTAAYAWSSDAQILGIPSDGTFNYGNVALQFAYDLTPDDRVVIQLSHERLGDSPINDLREDIDLDWAFYHHRFNSGTTVRVGRIPIPYGIYNELRDVGTLLELYRPPVSLYFEGAFSNEAVDGVVVSHRFGGASPWSLKADAYLGTWERLDSTIPSLQYAPARANDAYGAQLWLETPLDGLRFGVAAQHFDFSGGLEDLRLADEDPVDNYLFSVDGTFDRFSIRAEVNRLETQLSVAPETDFDAYYVQVGYRFNDRWSAYVQAENSELSFSAPPLFSDLEVKFYKDFSVAIRYQISPNAVLRLEGHRVEASIVEELTTLPAETDYGILSLSTSF